METFTRAKAFRQDSGFVHARRGSLSALDLAAIDAPIRHIVDGLTRIPHIFTLQCCYGHFLWYPEQDPRSLEKRQAGAALRNSLARLGILAPGFIQFGSADWFRERWPNSYVLQAVPDACKHQDVALLEPASAMRTRRARDLLFEELRKLVAAEPSCL